MADLVITPFFDDATLATLSAACAAPAAPKPYTLAFAAAAAAAPTPSPDSEADYKARRTAEFEREHRTVAADMSTSPRMTAAELSRFEPPRSITEALKREKENR